MAPLSRRVGASTLLDLSDPGPTTPAPSGWNPFHPAQALDGVWSPIADLEETDNAYVVDVELPGAKKDDVTIGFHCGELTIAGELKERERSGTMRWKTRRAGQFDYRITLPDEVEANGINAFLADGVLTVTVPKAEKPQPRRIKISAPEKRALEPVSQLARG
jgi:HSP20 family protein